jgi:hypothetical protein
MISVFADSCSDSIKPVAKQDKNYTKYISYEYYIVI